MKGLLVLLSTVAIASCSPTSGLPGGALGGESGGIPGGHGIGRQQGPGAQHGNGGLLRGGAFGGESGGIPGGHGIGRQQGHGAQQGNGGLLGGGALDGGSDAILGGQQETSGQQVASGGLLTGVTGLVENLLGGDGEQGKGGQQGAGRLLGGLVGQGSNGHTDTGNQYPQHATGLGGPLAVLLQALGENVSSVLSDVLQLRIPAVLDDGFNAVISVGRGVGGIVDSLIPGLGSLLGNLVVSLGKILICILGSPGLTGGLLGNTPGRDNPRDIPYICTPDYGRNWGSSYDGRYDANSIISHYHVKNARQQALEYINKFTHGRGVDSLTGSRKIVVIYILKLAEIADKGSSNWSDDDIKNIAIYLVIIQAALGDSHKKGLGPQIVDQWISTLNKNNKNKRFPDLSQYRSEIIAELHDSNQDSWNGAINNDGSITSYTGNTGYTDNTGNGGNDEAYNGDGSVESDDTQNDGGDGC